MHIYIYTQIYLVFILISENVNLSIPGVRISKLSLANVIKKKTLDIAPDQSKENNSKLQDTDNLFTKFCNPDPFAACVTEDPFLSR